MIRNYLPGLPYCYTWIAYNEGDGITMAMAVGADLWHMNNFAGPSMALKVPEFRTTFSMVALHFAKQPPGGMIVVGPDGKRFADEKTKPRTEGQNRWALDLFPPMPDVHDLRSHAVRLGSALRERATLRVEPHRRAL
jgi:hypothetical protein